MQRKTSKKTSQGIAFAILVLFGFSVGAFSSDARLRNRYEGSGSRGKTEPQLEPKTAREDISQILPKTLARPKGTAQIPDVSLDAMLRQPDMSEPDARTQFRSWTGANGASVFARFIGFRDTYLLLESASGDVSRVEFEALSDSDQAYVRKSMLPVAAPPLTPAYPQPSGYPPNPAGAYPYPQNGAAPTPPSFYGSAPPAYPQPPAPTSGHWAFLPQFGGWVFMSGNNYAQPPFPGYGQPYPPSEPPTQPSPYIAPSYPEPPSPYSVPRQGATLVNQAQPPVVAMSAPPPSASPNPETDPNLDYPKLELTPVEPSEPMESAPTEPSVEPVPEPQIDPARLLSEKRYAELAQYVNATQDAGLSRGLAWSMYQAKNYDAATKWFRQAIEWEPGGSEAYYGLALSEQARGNLEAAEEIARNHQGAHPQMANLLGDILTSRGMKSYERKQYRSTIKLLDEVRMTRGLTRDEEVVYAWSLFNSGAYQQAGARFEKLYDEYRDENSASGLYASYAKMENWSHLGTLADRYDGPLAAQYDQHLARSDYSSGYRRSAAALDPKNYGTFAEAYEPRATVGVGYRTTSGGSKFDDLDVESIPVLEFSNPIGDVSSLTFGVASKSYRGGTPVPGDNFGSPSLVGRPTFVRAPEAEVNGVIDVNAAYEREGPVAPVLAVGFREGVEGVDGIFTGKAALEFEGTRGKFGVKLYRDSIEESTLSAVGQIDPYTGRAWGGVTETGLGLDAVVALDYDMTLRASAQGGTRRGTNVASNDHWRLTTDFAKNVEVGGFEYFTLGTGFSYDAFSRNVSQFTFGHGGYFSPQNLVQAAVGVDFLTEEGRNFLMKGSFRLGVQKNEQDAAPFFPFNVADPRVYTSDETSTGVFYAGISAMQELSNQWRLGSRFSYAKTAGYDEFNGLFYLSYKFDPSYGLYNNDLAY